MTDTERIARLHFESIDHSILLRSRAGPPIVRLGIYTLCKDERGGSGDSHSGQYLDNVGSQVASLIHVLLLLSTLLSKLGF